MWVHRLLHTSLPVTYNGADTRATQDAIGTLQSEAPTAHQPHQNQSTALTLHSRHHIRDPQFSPNQQATLEIEKTLLEISGKMPQLFNVRFALGIK